MEGDHYRNIKSGKEYDYLFPKAKGEEITINWNANVYDTLEFIPKMVLETLSDTKELSKLLKGASIYETCHNIWDFVYNHIQYHYDEEGKEQVRRAARSWMDRVRGVDCDCYTVFISSVLTNLNIPHIYRITKYKNKVNYQHIYPIVPIGNGKYITIDAVVNSFNHEEPYTQKKDTNMKLTYLNGIEDTQEPNTLMAILPISDLANLPDFEDFDGVGKTDIGEKFKDVAHIANRANPATTLLRLGMLASMKLNLFKVGSHLRYAYLTDEQATAQNMDMEKIKKLRTILKKTENIFYGAGGKPESLKKAILTGEGNKDKSVSGVIPMAELKDDFNGTDDDDEKDITMSLKELLSGLYEDEYVDTTTQVRGLGDPATGTAVAAATTVIGTIAAIIKSVGTPKLGGAKTVSSSTTVANADGTTTTDTTSTTPDTTTKPTFSENAQAFFTEHKTVIVVGGVVLVSAVVAGVLYHHHTKHKHPAQASQAALSGAPSRKKRRGKKYKKAPIALL